MAGGGGMRIEKLRWEMKRDPESYVEEWKLLYRSFKYSIDETDIVGGLSGELGDKAYLFAELSTSYPQLISDFPNHLFFLLHRLLPSSLTSLRLRLTQSLILLLNKNSGEEKLANRSLVVLCNLQRINVWCTDVLSNAICRACYHPFPSLRKAALSFVVSHDEKMMIHNDDNDNHTEDVSSSEEEGQTSTSAKVVLNRELVYKAHHLGTTASKKKKKAKLKRCIRNATRQQRRSKTTTPNQYSPLSLLQDPDGFVDELYSCLHNNNRRVQLSEVNIMIIRVIARTLGLHRLVKPKFYSFLGKYLMPHEKEIIRLLAAAVDVFHDDVPDDDVKPLYLQVVNNFVHNRSQPEEIAVGLNVVREISLRMPQLMNEDLLEDLVSYNKHSVKSISIAAHSLLKISKGVNPSILSRKFRPRFATNAIPKQFGEVSVATGVPGAELLWQHIKNDVEDYDSTEVEKDDDADDDNGKDEDEDEDDVSDEDAEDDVGDDEDVVMAYNGLDHTAVNAGEVREDDVEMEEDFSTSIESDDSHVEISGERKRKYDDFDQQLKTAESDFRSLKKLAVPKTEPLSGTDHDHFYSNEEFKQIKKLLGTQHQLQRCSKSATFKVPSSDQLSSKPVNPAKLEASIRTKTTKEERVKSAKAGREDKNEYKSRTAVKQNKRGGSSNRQKDHKKFMPIAAKRGKIARSKQEKKRKKISGKQFRGKKAWK